MLISAGFHYVRPSFEQPYAGIFGVTPEQFRSQLLEMRRYAPFIAQADVRRHVEEGAPLPDKAWLVTFDDGLREQYEFAWPILRELDIPAVLFINTGPIAEESVALVHKIHLLRSQVHPDELEQAVHDEAEAAGITIEYVDAERAVGHYIYDSPAVARLKFLLNFSLAESDREHIVGRLFSGVGGFDEAAVSRGLYMTRDQVAELAAHDAIGSHTHTHRALGLVDAAVMERDIAQSLNHLRDWTGRDIDSLSYPYGSRAASPVEAARVAYGCGVRMAFTMERAGWDGSTSPLLIPRAAENDLPGGRTPRWDADRIFTQIGTSNRVEDVL